MNLLTFTFPCHLVSHPMHLCMLLLPLCRPTQHMPELPDLHLSAVMHGIPPLGLQSQSFPVSPLKEPMLHKTFAHGSCLATRQVEELSEAAQQVIHKYCREAGSGKYAPLCAVGSVLPWSNPTLADFELLAQVGSFADVDS